MRLKSCTTVALVVGVMLVTVSLRAQAPPVELPQIVLTVKHSEIVSPPGSAGYRNMIIIKIQSSNPSVATAERYGANQVQIVAIAPGKTTVQFYNNNTKTQYNQPVWVQDANATGGGGSGFDPHKKQLKQLVMQINHTENVTVPGAAKHQLSSVVSSNPSVATARTNTRSTIQVYAKALGDTFVDFSDNATGSTYQVHVWVTAAGAAPPAEPTGGSPNSRDQNSNPISAPIGSPKVDRCLVGTWQSEPAALASHGLPPVDIYRAGGLIFTVKRDGNAIFDYDKTATVADGFGAVGDTFTIRGQVSARITADGRHSMIRTSAPTSTAVGIVHDSKGTSEKPFEVFEPMGSAFTYDCSADVLIFKFGTDTMKFNRINE